MSSLLHTALGGSPGPPGARVQDGIRPGRQVEEVIRLRKILRELVLWKKHQRAPCLGKQREAWEQAINTRRMIKDGKNSDEAGRITNGYKMLDMG